MTPRPARRPRAIGVLAEFALPRDRHRAVCAAVRLSFFTACAIGRVEPDAARGCIWPYLGALLIAVILVTAIPSLSTGFL
jgi:hypothetical protein